MLIPGGEFIYQDGERRRIETFHIARYPVTNAQFRAFLADPKGYRNDRWWRGMSDAIRLPTRPVWNIANQPREWVCWYDAMAFCAWLSAALGFAVTLPTEEQWERAARGTHGREYPWGEGYSLGYANVNETWKRVGPHDLGQTGAVGIYPQNTSPEGVLDLAGNVWEWCLNEYLRPRRTQRDGSESRVIRGGSWNGRSRDARASYRLSAPPQFRQGFIGFRVLCVSPVSRRLHP